jgi:5-methylcytosine-specific restriction endonuclease McrA
MNPRYPLVAGRADHRCEYCRAPEAIFNLPFEVEHIIPRSREGGDDESNWALACRSCNLYKSDQLEGLDEVTGETVRLFHPRQDRWEDHFRIEAESGTIVGLTPIGRATVATFRVNRPHQLAARRQWMRLRLFP